MKNNWLKIKGVLGVFLMVIYIIAIDAYWPIDNPKWTPYWNVLTIVPLSVFFLWVNYLFFFDKNFKKPNVRPTINKLMLCTYIGVVILIGVQLLFRR